MRYFQETVCHVFAAILVFAAFMKLLDPFFSLQTWSSPLFLVSLIVDLGVANLLLFGNRVRRTFFVAALAFLAYWFFVSYQLTVGRTVCSCFGSGTPLIMTFIIDGIAVGCFLSLTLFSENRTEDRMKSLFSAGHGFNSALICFSAMVCLVLAVVVWGRGQQSQSELSQVSMEIVESTEPNPRLKLVIKNQSAQALKLVGLEGSCQVALLSGIPAVVEPQSETTVFLIGSKALYEQKMALVRGSAKFYLERMVESEPILSSARLNWGLIR